MVSKFITELAEHLTEDETWNPHTLQSNMLNDIDTTPVSYKGKFATAQPLIFDYAAKPLSIQVFIDDMITLVIDNTMLIYRAIHAIPLILDSIFRPNLPGEPMSRNPILSQKRLKEEGILSGQQVILGWLINTRMLKLFVTKDKACQILIELKDMVKQAKQKMAVHRKNLESMIGKLNGIAFIVPEGRFFLNCLRYRHKVAP